MEETRELHLEKPREKQKATTTEQLKGCLTAYHWADLKVLTTATRWAQDWAEKTVLRSAWPKGSTKELLTERSTAFQTAKSTETRTEDSRGSPKAARMGMKTAQRLAKHSALRMGWH